MTPEPLESNGSSFATETLHDVVDAGREMFAAGERVVRDIESLRRASGRGSRFRINPYFLLGISIGVCVFLAAKARSRA